MQPQLGGEGLPGERRGKNRPMPSSELRAMGGVAGLLFDERATTFMKRTEGLISGDRDHELVNVPGGLRFGRRFHLKQVHRVKGTTIRANGAFAEKRIIC